MLCSIKMFEESERLHPVQEEETIKVEKIRGHIVFIGTEDDTLWNAAKYIRRMDERLKTPAPMMFASVLTVHTFASRNLC